MNFNDTMSGLKNELLYGHKNNRLNCGFFIDPHRFGSSAWTFEDNFSTYANTTEGDAAWPTSSTSVCRVNPTNDNLDFAYTTQDGNRIYHDLGDGLVSNELWLLRFKVRFSTLTIPGASNYFMYIGLFDSTAAKSTNQGYIALAVNLTSGGVKDLRFATAYNQALQSWTSSASQYTGLTTSTDYFIELKRTANNEMKGSVSSSTAFSKDLLSEQTVSVNTSLANTRYIAVKTDTYGVAVNFTGTVDDVQFRNNSNSPP